MKPDKVMLVADTPIQSIALERALLDEGLVVVYCLESTQGLIKKVESHQPDIIVIALESPDRNTLDNVAALNQYNPKPIILFANDSDSNIIFQATQAGVSAYVVGGPTPNRIKPIIDAAIARFQGLEALKKELQQARNQLADRKTIDKAKGLLMRSKGLDEEQAYHAMRKMAMDQSKPLVDVAQNILSVMALLSP